MGWGMADRVVICMKWGTAFAPDYVNVLYSASRRAMRSPFRFVCLTDNPAGLAPGVETFGIPEIGLEPAEWYRRGAWPKIGLFDGHLHGLRGRGLFIDLDMMILRDLDAFFDHDRPFVGIDAGPDWGRGGATDKSELGTGIFAYDLGAHAEIPQTFRHTKAQVFASLRNEQRFVEGQMPRVDYWPEGWVISFKRSLRRPIGPDLFLSPRKPPDSAKVIAFHGKPRPIDLIRGRPRFWDRFPHLGNGRVGWVADYWEQNGGGPL